MPQLQEATAVQELLLREYVRESLHHGNHVLISEGNITQAVANNAVQWIVAGSVEYGLGGLTLPAAGAGLAVGPAAETAVDAAFGAKKVLGVVESATNIYEGLEEFTDAFKDAIAAYSGGDLGGYYEELVRLTKSVISLAGDKGKDALEKLTKKIISSLQKLIAKIVGALNSGIKIIVPDATVGAGIATAIEAAVMKLSENSYDLIEKSTLKFDVIKEFIADPGVAVEFFKDLLGQVADLFRKLGAQIKEQGKGILGKAKAIAKYGPVGGVLIPQFGPDGFQKLGDLIDEQIPTLVKVVNGVLKVLLPALITAVGFIQILLRGDWKEDKEEEATNESFDRISRNEIRNVIADVLYT